MTRTWRTGLVWILLCCGISVLFGNVFKRSSPNDVIDFALAYYIDRTLLLHHDPYIEGEPLRTYQAENSKEPEDALRRNLKWDVYFPAASIFIAPFAILPWGPAHILWITLTVGAIILAALLIWDIGVRRAPNISLVLICIQLANIEVLFAVGNPAGIAVSLCVIAVWCFFKERFMLAGALCLAVSLAIKPHNAGLVWLYFLLAGGVYRKRALQTLALIAALSLPAILWVSHVAPHWMPELYSNLLADSVPGGLNDPGPANIHSQGPGQIIDLQSTISFVRDDPRFYNSVSYLVCGSLLLVWSVRTLRLRFSERGAWLALAAVAPLTLLVTYHRPYDAKLLLLTVPACAIVWAEGGLAGWLALLFTSAGIVSVADIPLIIFRILTENWHMGAAGIFGKILTVVLLRPTPLILLAMAIFYLWVYVRRGPACDATAHKPLLTE